MTEGRGNKVVGRSRQSLRKHQVRLFQRFFELRQERGGRRAIGDAVVKRQAQVHHRVYRRLTIDGDNRIGNRANTENGGLRRVDNRVKLRHAKVPRLVMENVPPVTSSAASEFLLLLRPVPLNIC